MQAKMSIFALSTIALLAHTAVAAPRLYARDISCPDSNGTVLTAATGHTFQIECGIDRWGGDLPAPNGQKTTSLDTCVALCTGQAGCVSVQWVDGWACYLKGATNNPTPKSNVWGAVPVQVNTVTVPVIPVDSAETETEPITAQVSPVENHVSIASDVPAAASTLALPATSAIAAPSSTPSSISSSTPSTGSSGSTSGSCVQAKALSSKRGLCYNDAAMTKLFGSKISWAYNWGQTPGSIASSLDYSPMLWGQKFVSGWASVAQAAIDGGADTLLGFNEPDLGAQANMAVSDAVSLWKSSMQPFACKARLAAPAVTNGAAPLGLTYLSSFIAACSGCTIDVVPIHWYDSATNIDYFKNYIQDAYTAGGNRPIWITEFGASGSDAQITTFLQTVLPWLDSLAYVERYAYFMAGSGTLIDSSGSALSTIGQAYNSI